METTQESTTHGIRPTARAMRYETAYFLLMGAVHGASNLGGSLLTALVHHKNYEKDAARVTVAASYATFAAVQMLTLALFSKTQIDIPYADNAVYLVVGALVFVLTDAVFYRQLDRERYAKLFAGFLALSGAVLISKSLN